MYLRIKAGAHAGKIGFYPAHIGKVLLADGRAELEHPVIDPVAELPATPQVSEQTQTTALPKVDASATKARKPAAKSNKKGARR